MKKLATEKRVFIALAIALFLGVLAPKQITAQSSQFVTVLRNVFREFVADGSVTAPSYSFASETGMGLYRISANILGFATGGVERARLDGSGVFTTTAITAGSGSFNGNGIAVSNANGALFLGGGGITKLFMVTAPSAPTSCGVSPTVTSSNGSAVFVVTGGTGGAATGCTVTLPTASTGWVCSVNNITSSAAHRADRATVQTASTTTSATWEYQAVSTGVATAFTASDVFRGICFAY